MSADYYRTIGRVLEEGKFHLGFFDDRLAMPDRYGNDHRHTVEHGIRCVKMDPITVLTVMGMATEAAGSRRHLLHHLFRAVPRGARVRDARPDDRRPRRLERRDVDERRRSAEHGPRRASGARLALRPRRRVHGGGARPLELLGRRRASSSTSRPGCSRIPTRCGGWTIRAMVPLAWSVHRASVAAGPSGGDPGRAERPRQGFLRALGRVGVRLHAHQHGARQAALSRDEGRCRKPGPRSGPVLHHAVGLCRVRRDQGGSRGQDGADRDAGDG